jgi:hypothetical protein
MRHEQGQHRVPKPETKECLPRPPDFVAKPSSPSFERNKPTWEASTLPLSYTRQNHAYFSPKVDDCKGGSAALSKTTFRPPISTGWLRATAPEAKVKAKRQSKSSPEASTISWTSFA